jgi:hypothetical protein
LRRYDFDVVGFRAAHECRLLARHMRATATTRPLFLCLA